MGNGEGINADERRHIGEGGEEVAVRGDVGADVRQGLHAEGEKTPVGVEGQLGVAHIVAGVLVGGNGFAALARPLHGPAELARRPQSESMLGILPALGAEGAPDIAHDDANLVLGHLEDVAGEGVPDAMRVLDVGIEGVTVLARIVDSEGAPRLHVLSVHPRDDVAATNHARGACEGGIGGGLVAHLEEVGDIVGALVPDGSAADGVRGARDGRQRLVVDAHRLRRVGGLGGRLRDHEGEGIAHVTRAILGEAPMGGRPHGRAVGALALEGHLHRAEAVEVGSREHGDHAGRSGGRRGVDGADARVGVGGPHDHHVRLAGQVDVVMKAAFTAEEADVLEALH